VKPIRYSPDCGQLSRRYLMGMGALSLLSLGYIALAPAAWRPALWLALGLAMVVQIPLGTWLLATVGRDRFLAVWVLGMLARLVLIGVAGLVLFPALRSPSGPGLLTLVGLLMASLALEGLVLLLDSGEGDALRRVNPR
jgi:hypothetical protein